MCCWSSGRVRLIARSPAGARVVMDLQSMRPRVTNSWRTEFFVRYRSEWTHSHDFSTGGGLIGRDLQRLPPRRLQQRRGSVHEHRAEHLNSLSECLVELDTVIWCLGEHERGRFGHLDAIDR